MVPYLSSLGASDLHEMGIHESVDSYIVRRGQVLRDAGCDGLIVSGTAIRACRKAFDKMTIVSPGIRPAWAGPDDGKAIYCSTLCRKRDFNRRRKAE